MHRAQINHKQQQQLESEGEQRVMQQLCQLATNLSMQLGIPFPAGSNPLDIHFVAECTNAVIGGFNQKWHNIQFKPIQQMSQEQIDRAWIKLIKIVQSSMLEEGQTIMNDADQVGIAEIMTLYQLLCQGCEVLRQDNLQPMSQIPTKGHKNEKPINNSNPKINQANKSKKQVKNPQSNKQKLASKSKQKQPKTIKQNSKKQAAEKNVQKKAAAFEPKARPKSSKPAVSSLIPLQKQIIQNITKTMTKTYLTKAQPKRQALIREKEGTQQVQKAKRRFQHALKEYQTGSRLAKRQTTKQQKKGTIKIENGEKKEKKDVVDHAYMKMLETKHKRLNDEIQSQQLRYYLQMRDKKVAYIRHIHKLIQKLQRQRQVDSNKRQQQLQKQKKQQIHKKLQQVDNIFTSNMQKLHQNYKQRKKVEQLQNIGDIEVCRQMQRNMKNKKQNQMKQIKEVWEQERNNLAKIVDDQEKMKNKLYDIFRKYRVT